MTSPYDASVNSMCVCGAPLDDAIHDHEFGGHVFREARGAQELSQAVDELRRVWREGGDVLLHGLAGGLRDTTRINELRAAIDEVVRR